MVLDREVYELLVKKGLQFHLPRSGALSGLLSLACRHQNKNAIDALLQEEDIDVRPSILALRSRSRPEDEDLLRTLEARLK